MNRHEIINEIIKRKGYTKYLEIGIDNPDLCFNKIECENKTGVDPYADDTGCHQWDESNVEKFKKNIKGDWEEMTSDEFFKRRNKYDFIFIDGLHKEEQVDKDIENALKHLLKGGMIMLHDTMPKSIEQQVPEPEPKTPWVGTVYRSFWKLRMIRKDLDLATVNFDTGFSFIRPGSNVIFSDPKYPGLKNGEKMSFMYWKMNTAKVMNIITLEQFYRNWCASE